MIFIAVLLIILWLPCGVYARYSTDGIEARLIIGPFRFNLLNPRKSKSKNPKQKQPKFESRKNVKEKRKLADFWPIVKLVFALLSDFKRRLIIHDLQLKLVLGGSDPYSIAINYGRYWMAIGNLIPHLDSWFTFKQRRVEIECDYTADSTQIDASLDLRLSIGTLLHMVLHHGIRILIKYFEISKQTKDGVVS